MTKLKPMFNPNINSTPIPDDWRLESYDYQLPPELMAQRPVSPRDHSRLMVWDENSKSHQHQHFFQLTDHLPNEALLVFNQTKVFPSRLFAHKQSGGKAEIFLLQGVADKSGHFSALLRTTGKKKVGDIYLAEADASVTFSIVEVVGDGTFKLASNSPLQVIIEKLGSIPLPPYIREGVADQQDQRDYQTTFARDLGSVAAPTAGLHFTPELLQKLAARGVHQVPVTLHVGPGTFAPVKSANITEHQMHAESFQVSRTSLECLIQAWQEKRPVIAVGTTSLRTLESLFRLWQQGQSIDELADRWHQTRLYLYPDPRQNAGQNSAAAQGLITNFHLPKSSLLLLVASLIGRKRLMELYSEAISQKYRFYSYGDAMLLKLW
jgi:S-adenosylmethionine:tRNA ribosyltransferase-isomerase